MVHASLRNEKWHHNNIHFRSITYITNQYTDLGAPVWHTFQLDSSNLVYLIECKICGKLYVGQTKNKLVDRVRQHVYHIGRDIKTTEMYVHFRRHGTENLLIAGLETRTG